MRTPKEILQKEIDDMNKGYAELLKNRPHKGHAGYDENAADRAKINARINEFNNAISKLL